MALRERLIRDTVGDPAGRNGSRTAQYSFQEMKSRLHRTLINRMDLTKLGSLSPEQVHAEVSRLGGKCFGPGGDAAFHCLKGSSGQ